MIKSFCKDLDLLSSEDKKEYVDNILSCITDIEDFFIKTNDYLRYKRDLRLNKMFYEQFKKYFSFYDIDLYFDESLIDDTLEESQDDDILIDNQDYENDINVSQELNLEKDQEGIEYNDDVEKLEEDDLDNDILVDNKDYENDINVSKELNLEKHQENVGYNDDIAISEEDDLDSKQDDENEIYNIDGDYVFDDIFDDDFFPYDKEDDESINENKISKEQKAYRLSIDFCEKNGLTKRYQPVLEGIFLYSHYGATIKALQFLFEKYDIIDTLALEHALKLKIMWSESEEFWASLLENGSYNHNHRILSWKLAYSIVDSYESIPDIEELFYNLSIMLEEWYNHRSLQLSFSSFVDYLYYIYYYTNDTYPNNSFIFKPLEETLEEDLYDLNVSKIEGDDEWLY